MRKGNILCKIKKLKYCGYHIKTITRSNVDTRCAKKTEL